MNTSTISLKSRHIAAPSWANLPPPWWVPTILCDHQWVPPRTQLRHYMPKWINFYPIISVGFLFEEIFRQCLTGLGWKKHLWLFLNSQLHTEVLNLYLIFCTPVGSANRLPFGMLIRQLSSTCLYWQLSRKFARVWQKLFATLFSKCKAMTTMWSHAQGHLFITVPSGTLSCGY